MEDLSLKQDGFPAPDGQLPAHEFVQPMKEIQGLITSSGITLEATGLGGVDVTMLASAVATSATASDFFTGSGTANAQVLTSVSPRVPIRSYAVGMRVRWIPSLANDAAPVTIDIDGVGVVNVKNEPGVADIAIGDIAITRYAEAIYDGVNFRLLVRTLASAPAAYPPGHNTGGLLTTVNATDFSVGPISVRGKLGNLNGDNASTITKGFDAVFTLGDNGGAFPAAVTRTAAEHYHLHMILKDDGAIDFGIDDNASATKLLAAANAISGDAGWIDYFQLGFLRADAVAGEFSPIFHELNYPDRVVFVSPHASSVVGAWTINTPFFVTTACPVGASADLAVSFQFFNISNGRSFYGMLTNPDQTLVNPSTSTFNITARGDNPTDNDLIYHVNAIVGVDATRRVRFEFTNTDSGDATIRVCTNGFYFRRGQ